MISCRNPLGIAQPALRLLLLVAVVAAWPAADAVAAAPPNDDFNQAQPIRPGATFQGTTVGATMQRREPRPYSRARTVWYRLRSRRKVTVALAICRLTDYLWADVSIYSGRSLRSLRPVDFRRGEWLGVYSGKCSRRVTFTARPGRTYRIAVAGHSSPYRDFIFEDSTQPGRARRGGPFGLRVRAIDAPPNDDFADAAPIAVGDSVRGHTHNATLELGEPKPWPNTVWYHLRVSRPTIVELTAEGSGAPELWVYTGPKVSRLRQPDTLGGDASSEVIDAQPGIIYRIQIACDNTFLSKSETMFRLNARNAGPDWAGRPVSHTAPP